VRIVADERQLMKTFKGVVLILVGIAWGLLWISVLHRSQISSFHRLAGKVNRADGAALVDC
jgi:hypothetical protein